MKEILVDKEGYNQFFEKLENLKNESTSNANTLSKSFNDYVGDGWHDNPVYEEAMRKSRMIDDDIQKMLDQQKYLKVVEDDYNESLVNINDIVEIEYIYSKDDKETEIIKLTGKYIPNTDLQIKEITLNSPVGKTIYKKKLNETYSYNVGNNTVNIRIIRKL